MYRISEKHKCANINLPLYCVNRSENSNSITIVNPHKVIGHKIVQFLANERSQFGTDSLENNPSKLNSFVEKTYLPYKKDPSLFIYELIIGMMSENRYTSALKLSMKAVRLNPLKLKNYRTTFYIFRKWILS